MEGLTPVPIDPTTERTSRGAARLRTAVSSHARHAMERGIGVGQDIGTGGLAFTDKVRIAYLNAFQHDCLNTAKATAYSAIFALFPALLVLASLVTLLPYTAPLRFQLAIFFDRVLPESVAPLLEHFFISAHGTDSSARMTYGALLVSLTGSAGVLGTLMEGFRRAYGLMDGCWGPGLRGQVRRYLQSFLLVPIALVPLAVASILVVFGHYLLLGLDYIVPHELHATFYFMANLVRWSASLSATAAVVAFIYRWGVPVRPRWREVVPGAAFATGTWFIATICFGWYVTRFANYSRVYGSLGTGVVLLVWLFLTALSVLCGAELNAELARDEAVPGEAHC